AAVQAQLGAHNRQVQDLQDLQSQMDSLTSTFGSGLSNAISGALNGQKYAFVKFGESMGKSLMDSAFSKLSKQLEGSLEGTGIFGGLFGQAQGSTDALGKLAGSQMEKTMATASMTVHAANV